MCKTAFDTALVALRTALRLRRLQACYHRRNVAAALEYTEYPEFKEAACEAAVFVAEKIRVSQPSWNWNEESGDEARDAAAKILVDGMKKVLEVSDDADLKERAQKLL